MVVHSENFGGIRAPSVLLDENFRPILIKCELGCEENFEWSYKVDRGSFMSLLFKVSVGTIKEVRSWRKWYCRLGQYEFADAVFGS